MSQIAKSIIKNIIYWVLSFYAYFQFFVMSKKNDLKIEFGAGKKGNGGWITIDVYRADIIWNLTNSLPIADDVVQEIYHSHLLEHLNFKQINDFLLECYRILKPGGHMKVCVPNAGNYIQAYYNRKYFRDDDQMYAKAIVDSNSFIDQLNYIAYMDGEHKFMFDEQNAINLILKAGFTSVSLREFEAGLDLEDRKFESLFVIAYK